MTDDPQSTRRFERSPPRSQLVFERVAIPVVAGVFHGLLARAAFGASSVDRVLEVMTASFIFVVPFGIGVLTVSLAARRGALDASKVLLAPMGAALTALIASLALAWEGVICVVLWLPLYIVLAMAGGLVAAAIVKLRNGGPLIGGIVLAPYLLAPLETRLPLPESIRTVENEIVIRAPLETVWANVARVPAFREDEHHFGWSHVIGFPRPVEATLSHEGVGGVRHATFERGVLFIETITRWDENERLTFSIHADATTIPPTTLDQHVTVGGPFFDVLEGEYELTPRADGSVLLQLRSRHRVSTRFNFYATLWTDWIMSDVQAYILEIVRRRCEAGC